MVVRCGETPAGLPWPLPAALTEWQWETQLNVQRRPGFCAGVGGMDCGGVSVFLADFLGPEKQQAVQAQAQGKHHQPRKHHLQPEFPKTSTLLLAEQTNQIEVPRARAGCLSVKCQHSKAVTILAVLCAKPLSGHKVYRGKSARVEAAAA